MHAKHITYGKYSNFQYLTQYVLVFQNFKKCQVNKLLQYIYHIYQQNSFALRQTFPSYKNLLSRHLSQISLGFT